MLSDRGIETVHWTDIGVSNAQDIDIMLYAYKNGYSVFTNDLDFSAILVSTRARGPSVIQIRAEDTRPESNLDRVTDILTEHEKVIEQGTVITIDQHKTRIHILPFTPQKNDS